MVKFSVYLNRRVFGKVCFRGEMTFLSGAIKQLSETPLFTNTQKRLFLFFFFFFLCRDSFVTLGRPWQTVHIDLDGARGIEFHGKFWIHIFAKFWMFYMYLR